MRGAPSGRGRSPGGEHAAARAYSAQALEAAGKIRFRPEVALAHLGLAEILAADGEHLAAVEHLNAAIPELHDLHMRPALERALSLRETLDARLAASPVVRNRTSGWLTARERHIAELLGAGRSNRAIAEKLVITEATVEVHVKRVLSKLNLSSRSQVAAWIAAGGLEKM